MMVIIRDHLNGENAEWMDTEDVDESTLEPDQHTVGLHAINSVAAIDNVQQWMDNPWQDA